MWSYRPFFVWRAPNEQIQTIGDIPPLSQTGIEILALLGTSFLEIVGVVRSNGILF